MAATITITERAATGNKYVRRGTLTLGSYATNGVAVAKADFELPVSLDRLEIDPAGGYVFEWDKANGKVKAYRQKDPANAGGADIPLPEVANAVNLAAIIINFQAIGN
jgi:hypothetical protein